MTRGARTSRLRAGYLLSNPWLAAYLRATDALIAPARLLGARDVDSAARPLNKVLLAVGGHLGDAIIATSTLEYLRRALPHARFGIVLPSWSRAVFEGDARLSWTHTVDHWALSRADASLGARVRTYRGSAARAIAEARRVGYDAAFDLYPYYPNMAGILWRARVPIRAGFATGGRAPLYTHSVEWVDDRVHVAEKHARLIGSVVRDASGDLLPSSVAAPARVARRELTKPYVVLHPGSGTRAKEWPIDRWRELAAYLRQQNVQIVFTGAGRAEREAIAGLASALPASISLADSLDWPALSDVISNAALVISGDTSVAHLAAAVRTPNIVLYTGINSIAEWRPLGHADIPMRLLTNEVPCAPCFRGAGCSTMECLRGIGVDVVARAAREILASSR